MPAIDDALAEVAVNLGRVGDAKVAQYDLVWYNRTQKQVCRAANFWFMAAVSDLSFTVGVDLAALPSGFKAADTVFEIDANSQFREIHNMDLMDQRRAFDDITQGVPTHYRTTAEGYMQLRPIPDDSYTIKMNYWKFLTDLAESDANTNELLTNYEDLMIAGTTMRGFLRLGQWENGSSWKKIFDELLLDLIADNNDRGIPDEFAWAPRSDVYDNALERDSEAGGYQT